MGDIRKLEDQIAKLERSITDILNRETKLIRKVRILESRLSGKADYDDPNPGWIDRWGK